MRFVVSPGIEVTAELDTVHWSPGRCEIDLTADAAQWMLVDGGLLFHLGDAEQTAGLPPVVAEGRPVHFTLRLDDALRVSVAATGTDAAALATALRRDGDDPLHRASSWFLTEMRQGSSGAPTVHFRTPFGTAAAVYDSDVPLDVTVHDSGGDAPASTLLAMASAMLDDVEIAHELLAPDLLRAPVATGDAHYNLFVHVLGRDTQLVVYATPDIVVPEARRTALMELVTRINPSLIGTWLELDLDEGVVSARGALLLEGITLDDDTFIENVVSAVMDTIERFAPAIEAVVDGLEPSDFGRTSDGG